MSLPKELPTVSQLVTVAAIAWRGDADTGFAARRAMALWNACIEEIGNEERHRAKRAADIAVVKAKYPQIDVPQPAKFPAALNEFLRLVIGGREYGKRMKLYREFLRKACPADIHTEDDVFRAIEEGKRDGLDEFRWNLQGENFIGWRKRRDAQERKEKSKKMTAGRYKKKSLPGSVGAQTASKQVPR